MGRKADGAVEHVLIVGAGFSGAMQAVNLLRHDGPRATLIERRPEPGRGTAYSSTIGKHILNVRASNMSAFPDDPGHFVRWLDARGLGGAADFVPRRLYGDYLSGLVRAAAAANPDRLRLVHDNAVGASWDGPNIQLALAGGETLHGDALVLAVGNLPPHDIAPFASASLPDGVYVADPWSGDLAGGLGNEDVLMLGTGLTMVDAILFLEAQGFEGRMVALSRHGLLPRAHAAPGPVPSRPAEKPPALSSALVRYVRLRSSEVGWRAAVDELRSYTQTIWSGATPEQRGRFLRHLRAWWDVHRHRIAPHVAAALAALQESGRLTVLAGTVVAAEAVGAGARVRWAPRGGEAERSIEVGRIVNCTGPQGDLLRSREPLLRDLIRGGLIRPDSLRIGIDVNAQSEAIRSDGSVQPGLFAIGPMTRGALWEIVAVPDIRSQTWALARRLSNAHWVEGEGL